MTTPRDVAEYYDRKLESILHKYGPGPRVHFHPGLVSAVPTSATRSEVRERMTTAQEAHLRKLAQAWGAAAWSGLDVVDIGCGVGGGALYWAVECGARVIGLTISKRQVEAARRLARSAGLADRISFQHADAMCYRPAGAPFAAAVSIGSSCYFDRHEWMSHVRSWLPPGGKLCIADTFLADESHRAEFDTYWNTQVGYLDEYFRAARGSGLTVDSTHDMSAETLRFWDLSLRWTELALSEESSPAERARLRRSSEEQRKLRAAWARGSILWVALSLTAV